jgi:hypothetical protein
MFVTNAPENTKCIGCDKTISFETSLFDGHWYRCIHCGMNKCMEIYTEALDCFEKLKQR